jgi:hypothetical protein
METELNILKSLMRDSKLMETKLYRSANYYQSIGMLLYIPGLIINALVGTWLMLISQRCHTEEFASDILTMINKTENSNIQNISNWAARYGKGIIPCTNSTGTGASSWIDYLVAALAFINTIVVVMEQNIRPNDNAKMFQVAARKWGTYIRRMAVYKHLYSVQKSPDIRLELDVFVTHYQVLLENAPLLPQWLLNSYDKNIELERRESGTI